MQTGSEYIREGSGAPVVMLHSSMSSKEQWSRLSTGLNGDFHTIAIDLYGYGDGDYPQNPSSFSLADEALRIDTIITELIGTEHFHLVGHSYGGATATDESMATSRPPAKKDGMSVALHANPSLCRSQATNSSTFLCRCRAVAVT